MAVAKANNLDLEVITADPQKPTVEHLKANPLGKIPAFLGEDGFALSEAIAVAIYSELEAFLICHTWCAVRSAQCAHTFHDDQANLQNSYPCLNDHSNCSRVDIV